MNAHPSPLILLNLQRSAWLIGTLVLPRLLGVLRRHLLGGGSSGGGGGRDDLKVS